MAGLNQIVISDSGVGLRSSLQTKDGTAVFECLQTFTPDEAREFASQMNAAAAGVDARLKDKAKHEKEKARESEEGKANKAKKKAAKQARKANR